MVVRAAEENGIVFVRVHLATVKALSAEHTSDCANRHSYEAGGQLFADVEHCAKCGEPSGMEIHEPFCICGAVRSYVYVAEDVLIDTQIETAQIERTLSMIEKGQKLKDRLPRWLGGKKDGVS